MIRIVAFVVVVVVVAAVSLAIAGRSRAAGPNSTGLLYLLDLGLLVLASGAALAQVGGGRYRTQGTLVVGLYALPIGAAFLCCDPLWSLVPGSLDVRSDNAILGAIFLGALIVLAGTALAVASAIVIAREGAPFGQGAGRAAMVGSAVVATAVTGALGFLVGGPQSWLGFFGALIGLIAAFWLARGPAGPARCLGLLAGLATAAVATLASALGPLAVVAVVALVAAGLLLAVRREWPTLRLPLAVAAGGALVPIALLVARGPEDWATAGQSVKLFGFPILAAGVAIGFGILELARLDRRGAEWQGG